MTKFPIWDVVTMKRIDVYKRQAEHMVKRHYGVRTDRYKLIHFYNDINWWELYDLQADPSEMQDVYKRQE